VLHVGVIGGAAAAPVFRRLLELGAVPATGRERSWDSFDDPAVFLHDGSEPAVERTPSLHLVVGVGANDDPGDALRPDADVRLDGGMAPEQLTAAVDALWHQRITAFEANVRASRRSPRKRRPVLVAPDPWWPVEAARLVARLQAAVGHLAVRIDHIGSTSVPDLPAKDLVDIQVVVTDLDVAREAADQARRAGFVRAPGEWSGMDRLGVEHPEEVAVDADPGRPTNVNFRSVTAPIWRETLVFRDWLRAHPDERDAYAAMKRRLATRPDAQVDDYGAAKMAWIRPAVGRAEDWARKIRWEPRHQGTPAS
jgi:dephospho-CoA kinase